MAGRRHIQITHIMGMRERERGREGGREGERERGREREKHTGMRINSRAISWDRNKAILST